jgi:soluble lytic murein transglycosylase-like protein
MTPRSALIALLALLALTAPACGGGDGAGGPTTQAGMAAERTEAPPEPVAQAAAAPRPDAPLPVGPDRLAGALRRTHRWLHVAIRRWRADADRRSRPPPEVTLYALYQQRIYVRLGSRPRLARAVIARLRGPVAAEARETLAARRDLGELTEPVPARRFATGPARPPGVLLGYYRRAERRFGVDWQVLAAVNLIESAFGRLRNESTAGARGPMQFIPSTWDAYGLGGDVDDPHDAIMGAANYLHASGAPRNYGRALYAYNRSWAYVDAVLSYARRMRRDPDAYFAYQSWQVFVDTPSGVRRLTGPGIDR